jgi:hypothetical protein
MQFVCMFLLASPLQYFKSPIFITFQSQRGCTALILASELGSTECVRLLLESGADHGIKDNVRHVKIYLFPAVEYLKDDRSSNVMALSITVQSYCVMLILFSSVY